MSTLYVRLKPYNPKKGHVVRRYNHVKYGVTLTQESGWVAMKEPLARLFEAYTQNPEDPLSPALCDVRSKEGAINLEKEEERLRRMALQEDSLSGLQKMDEKDVANMRLQMLEEDADAAIMADPDQTEGRKDSGDRDLGVADAFNDLVSEVDADEPTEDPTHEDSEIDDDGEEDKQSEPSLDDDEEEPRVRVHELAKEVGIKSTELLQELQEQGYEVKSIHSSVSRSEADSIVSDLSD